MSIFNPVAMVSSAHKLHARRSADSPPTKIRWFGSSQRSACTPLRVGSPGGV
jgi:hypothetical protein